MARESSPLGLKRMKRRSNPNAKAKRYVTQPNGTNHKIIIILILCESWNLQTNFSGFVSILYLVAVALYDYIISTPRNE